MEIKIDSDDLTRLKNKIYTLEKEKKELADQLKALNPEELREQHTRLANKMFDDVMERVFKELGFEYFRRGATAEFTELDHWLGKNWIYSDRLTIKLGATITSEMRGAFLALGIKEPEKKTD